MSAKQKKRHPRQTTPQQGGIAVTPVRLAVNLLGGIRPTGVKASTMNDWISGRRRAPRWFVELLEGELRARIGKLEAARRDLAAYRPQDVEAVRRAAAVRAREMYLQGRSGLLRQNQRARPERSGNGIPGATEGDGSLSPPPGKRTQGFCGKPAPKKPRDDGTTPDLATVKNWPAPRSSGSFLQDSDLDNIFLRDAHGKPYKT